MNRSLLLTIDSLINLLLGVLLVVFPRDLISFLGIPEPSSAFYPSILGAVLWSIVAVLTVVSMTEVVGPPIISDTSRNPLCAKR